jgi:MFS transporter, DHA1 family, inner membrane transport protein
VPVAVLAMAVGAFAIGLTEFAPMGLLPRIALDVGVSVPAAGLLVTAYAVGVVVGAPLLTAAVVRLRRRTTLLLLLGLFAAGNLLSALAPTFGLLVVARFLSGLPHGAFFGVASVVAASLVPARRRATAVATVLLGLTVANLAGVPATTALGGVLGWRPVMVGVATLGLVAAVGVGLTVARDVPVPPTGLRAELRVLRRPAVVLALATVVVGCGGLFGFLTYVAPIMTDRAGYPESAVPVLLAVFGLGMTLGSVLGGRLADRFDPRRLLVVLLGAQALLLVLAVPATTSPVLAAVVLFGVGLVGLPLVPAVQTVVMDAAGNAPTLASAAIHGAFNLANAIGAAAGAVVLGAGLGLGAPPLAGAVLTALGVVPAVAVIVVSRGRAAAPVPLNPAVAAPVP